MVHWLVIGNPENRRVRFWCDALTRADHTNVHVIPLLDLLTGKVSLEQTLRAISAPTVVRFESPGGSFEVAREILAAGADCDDPLRQGARIGASAARELQEERGRVRFMRQWYLGYTKRLRAWQAAIESTQTTTWFMNGADGIAAMFDKPRCQANLARAGVSVPPPLSPEPSSFDELLAVMAAQNIDRVFVKPCHGSSASGVIALSVKGREPMAITSLATDRRRGEARFYNSLRLSRYTRKNGLERVVNFILSEGAYVETWIPKAHIRYSPFDVRVVVIGGEPRHFIVRQGRSPLTNLHLGNRRGDSAAFLELIGQTIWDGMRSTCAQAVALFPDMLYAGVDIALDTELKRHYVLEVNAYGDLIPEVTYEGLSTYESEVQAMEMRLASAPM